MSKIAALSASALACVGLCAAVLFAYVLRPSHDCGGSVIAGGNAAIGGPFTLVDQTGRTVTEKDVITGPTLVYFGYTFCPDVCPLDVARNAEAVDLLIEAGKDVTPVFITIDPARDTPEALAEFAEYTHPNLIALTGTDEQVAAAAKAYKTIYKKNGEGEHYLLDHMTFTYLMGPDGMWHFFRRDTTSQQMADVTACFVDALS